MKYFIFIFIYCFTLQSLAQTIIHGSVIDVNGDVVDSYITICSKDNQFVIAYSETDKNGDYSINFTSSLDSVLVIASGMNIEKKMIQTKNRCQKLDFVVNQKDIQLKEASVHANKLTQKGDTITYLVSSYRSQTDRVIGDVLKKLPGIDIDEEGKIRFNGKSIKNFYIEEMDLLQGRYGLATNNIRASDIAKVQVIEHHQPIKVLQDIIMTDDVAINLKLKESAKGSVSLIPIIGIGFQANNNDESNQSTCNQIGQNPILSGNLVGLYFANNRQNLSVYKGNNSGEDLSCELTSHYSTIDNVDISPLCPISVISPSGSGLTHNRTYDNLSQIISINHLEKIDSTKELSFIASYYKDRVKTKESIANSFFIDKYSRLDISEHLSSVRYVNSVNTEMRYYDNNANGFLVNVLQCNINGDKETSRANQTTFDNIDIIQRLKNPSVSICNTLNRIKMHGPFKINYHFSAGYGNKDGILINEMDYNTIDQNSLSQTVNSELISGVAGTNINYKQGIFSFKYGLTGNVSIHKLKTELLGNANSDINNQNNNLSFFDYNILMNQGCSLKRRYYLISIDCPFGYAQQSINNHNGDVKKSNKIILLPYFSSMFEWNNLKCNVTFNYNKTLTSPDKINKEYIMCNYRTFKRGTQEVFADTDYFIYNLRLNYRNILHSFFMNFVANHNIAKSNTLDAVQYLGTTCILETINRKTSFESNILSTEASKGFDFMQTTLNLHAKYKENKSERLIGANIVKYLFSTISLGCSSSMSPISRVNIVYSNTFHYNKSKARNDPSSIAVRNLSQHLKVNFLLSRLISVASIIDDTYFNTSGQHITFGDIGIKYKSKNADFELLFNNIFNRRKFRITDFNDLDYYSTTSFVRPFNILLKISLNIN